MQTDPEYDFIIVGGGSAGCVLANRLSARGDRVLLLEAGGEAKPIPYDLPFLAAKLFERKAHNWNFRSEPQRHMDGAEIAFPRGDAWRIVHLQRRAICPWCALRL